jgi:short-subunit dehydrogenase
MNPRHIIILGATSAIGEAVARLYAGENACLLLAGRNPNHLAQIAADLSARGASTAEVIIMDLAQAADPVAQLATMVERIGGVDDILIFYGVLGNQKNAETDLAHARAIIATNFTSVAEWSLAAAQILEAQNRGSLIVIGSVAGDRGRQSNYVYGAAKGGLGILVQGIAHRLANRGSAARAVLVKPGFVDTPMTADIKTGGALWASPEAVAAIIRRAADNGGPIVYAPWFWRFILLIVRIIPPQLFNKLAL